MAWNIPLSVALGLLSWTLVEYLVHGVLCHRFRNPAARLHHTHHMNPGLVFTPPAVWIPAAIGVCTAAILAAGPIVGGVFSASLLAGFGAYEYRHWRFHYREPRNERERLARAHHLAHHFVNARAYHGVTTRLWDRIFGTFPDSWPEDYERVVDRPPLTVQSE